LGAREALLRPRLLVLAEPHRDRAAQRPQRAGPLAGLDRQVALARERARLLLPASFVPGPDDRLGGGALRPAPEDGLRPRLRLREAAGVEEAPSLRLERRARVRPALLHGIGEAEERRVRRGPALDLADVGRGVIQLIPLEGPAREGDEDLGRRVPAL